VISDDPVQHLDKEPRIRGTGVIYVTSYKQEATKIVLGGREGGVVLALRWTVTRLETCLAGSGGPIYTF
jgi:hypothetical protein